MIAQIEEEADREEKRRRFRSAMKYLTKKEQDLLNAMIYDRKTRADYAGSISWINPLFTSVTGLH